ncbi:chitin synthase export chaperone [Apiospora arundinis]
MTKNGNPHASSSSLNVNIDHAKAVQETYWCDSCRYYIEIPDLDGSVWKVPFDLSCGHRCCWDCTEPKVGDNSSRIPSECPRCHSHVTLWYDEGLFRALEERAARAAPTSPASSHSDSTLVYEQAYSNEGNRRGQDAAEPSRRDGGKDAGPHNSNGTEYSSDSDSALGEVSEDEGEEEEEEEDYDDDDDSEVGGARCDTRSPILERPEKRSSILEKPEQRSSLPETPERRPSVGQTADVFNYMDSKDVSTYEEKEQEQEQEKWHGHQPVSRETRRRPVSFYETRRYSVTPIVKTKRYSITPSMAAKMPPVYEAYGNESTYSLSSTRCEVSPTRVEGVGWPRDGDTHVETPDAENPRQRRRNTYRSHTDTEIRHSVTPSQTEGCFCPNCHYDLSKTPESDRPTHQRHDSSRTSSSSTNVDESPRKDSSSRRRRRRHTISSGKMEDHAPSLGSPKDEKHRKRQSHRSRDSTSGSGSGSSGSPKHSNRGSRELARQILGMFIAPSPKSRRKR